MMKNITVGIVLEYMFSLREIITHTKWLPKKTHAAGSRTRYDAIVLSLFHNRDYFRWLKLKDCARTVCIVLCSTKLIFRLIFKRAVYWSTKTYFGSRTARWSADNSFTSVIARAEHNPMLPRFQGNKSILPALIYYDILLIIDILRMWRSQKIFRAQISNFENFLKKY